LSIQEVANGASADLEDEAKMPSLLRPFHTGVSDNKAGTMNSCRTNNKPRTRCELEFNLSSQFLPRSPKDKLRGWELRRLNLQPKKWKMLELAQFPPSHVVMQ
jgi:hypothetical protein